VFPLATAKLERYIKRQGWWKEVSGAGNGSHAKYRHDGQMIILPLTSDVSLTVLSSTARTLGFKLHEFIELAR
jgi:predicted RNA binding protein YcfA (HicA-like mRNA interferase family)